MAWYQCGSKGQRTPELQQRPWASSRVGTPGGQYCRPAHIRVGKVALF